MLHSPLAAFAAAIAAAVWLRYLGLHWTWALVTLAPAWLLARLGAGSAPLLATAGAALLGARWHAADLRTGGDVGRRAGQRLGPCTVLKARLAWRRRHGTGWLDNQGLIVGRDDQGRAVRIPLGSHSGSHTLVVGATGAGKTVTQAWIAARAVDAGLGAVFVDPKGDGLLREQLVAAARRCGRSFVEWTPDGPTAYNPYGHGSDGEIADKALAGERYTEPHYLRQAQRYLGHAVRAMRVGGIAVTPASLVRHLDPIQLEALARRLPAEAARPLWGYLDSLNQRQQRDLAGTRDRLAILAESDLGRWLDPDAPGARPFELGEVLRERAVVYFRLDADRRPLLAQMLATAIVQDLVACAADLQASPVPTLVGIDEFSALAAERVARLFGRARSAGISLLLGTQELSDLRGQLNERLLEQVLGNAAAVIAHRQSVPESAELVAGIAGTRGAWITSERLEPAFGVPVPSGAGLRSRGREYLVHPDQIKALPTGSAAVIVPGAGRACVAHMCHPRLVG